MLVAVVAGCSEPGGERFQFTRVTMGVSTNIVVESSTREKAAEAAAAAFERIAEIEDAASDYRPQSELMRLCHGSQEVGAWVPVSDDLGSLLGTARAMSERTGGAFDVTVGPAVALWRAARKSGRLPEASALADARGRIDWRAVEIRTGPPMARLMKKRMGLDMGGIAKGYAAQEAVRVLERRGLPRCLVALAGDVYAGAAPSGQAGWRVEVRGDRSEAVIGTLLVEHAAVSTSGDVEQFVKVDGVRYSHIVDPRTGVGIVGGMAVTAIGEDGAYVDAADTGGVVLGLEGMRAAFSGDRRVTLIVHRASGAPLVIGDASRVQWVEAPRLDKSE